MFVAITLAACGGGGSDSPQSNEVDKGGEQQLRDFGDSQSKRGVPYNLSGTDGKTFYSTYGCTLGASKNSFLVYSNGFVEVSYQASKSSTYHTECMMEKAYLKVDIGNTTDLDADFYDGEKYGYMVFYDESLNLFFEINSNALDIDDVIASQAYKLVGITNDGLSAVIDKKNGDTVTVQLSEIFKEIPLSTIGINKYAPASFYSDNSDLLMEVGSTVSYPIASYATIDKVYDLRGFLYNYSDSGCDHSGSAYAIYNDGRMVTKDRTTGSYESTCNITQLYEKVELHNTTMIKGDYINQYTFYDSSTKIFYDHLSTNFGDSSDYSLVEIIYHGNYGVVEDSGGNKTIVKILSSYKQVS